MAFDIHGFVKDADNLDMLSVATVEHQMTFYLQLSVARPDMVARDPQLREVQEFLNFPIEIVQILICLNCAPLLNGVAPDCFEVTAGQWANKQLKHRLNHPWFRDEPPR